VASLFRRGKAAVEKRERKETLADTRRTMTSVEAGAEETTACTFSADKDLANGREEAL